MSDEPREELTEQVLGAEQDERRRIALFLHDGPVQSLSGIALMLDAALHFIDQGRTDDARSVLLRALDRHRRTIGELRDLSFNLEPVVLRDQGFGTAVRALGEQRGMEHGIRMNLDVAAAEDLGEQTQAALYQIVRESLDGAIRRGPPTSFSVTVAPDGASVATEIVDDAPGERRRRSIEVLEERVRTLGGALSVEQGKVGTKLRIVLPRYASTE
jgi:two-component system, NarL family, sensor histidine kinase UhpB